MAKGFSCIDDLKKFLTMEKVVVITTDGKKVSIPGCSLISSIVEHKIVAVYE